MKLSRLFILALAAVFIAAAGRRVLSQTGETPMPPMVSFNVRGVQIGTTIEEAKKLLGKPKDSRQTTRELCGEEEVIVLKYAGLTIDFGWWDEKQIWAAQDFEVTSANGDIGHGVKIGNSIDVVVSRFGKPWNEEYDTNTKNLGYTAAPGNDRGELSFKNGRLSKARWYVDPC